MVLFIGECVSAQSCSVTSLAVTDALSVFTITHHRRGLLLQMAHVAVGCGAVCAKSRGPRVQGPRVPGKKLLYGRLVLCTWMKLLTYMGSQLNKNAFGSRATNDLMHIHSFILFCSSNQQSQAAAIHNELGQKGYKALTTAHKRSGRR